MTTCLQLELSPPEAQAVGRVQAAACLEKTRQTEQTWPERAYRELCFYITIKRGAGPWSGERAVEFVLRQPGIEKPDTTRAFGSLFTKAAKQGLIQRSSEVFERTHGHGTKTLGWISL